MSFVNGAFRVCFLSVMLFAVTALYPSFIEASVLQEVQQSPSLPVDNSSFEYSDEEKENSEVEVELVFLSLLEELVLRNEKSLSLSLLACLQAKYTHFIVKVPITTSLN